MQRQRAMRIAAVTIVMMVGCGGKAPRTGQTGTETETETEAETGAETEAAAEAEAETEAEAEAETETETGAAADVAADAVPANSAAAAFLAAHNTFRKQHCAPPLQWSEALAKVAQQWADTLRKQGCNLEHSRNRYGENLAAGTSGALDPATTTEMWYREVDGYNFRKPGFSMSTGHFTQLVWAGTTHLGCGMTTCKGLDIIVCNYDPPGNVERGYAANVKAKGCK
jgi:uncharacterized protein YkwD